MALLCFGFMGCDDEFGAMSFAPEFYVAIPKDKNIKEIKVEYQTKSFYVHDDIVNYGEKITESDREYISELKEYSSNAVFWKNEDDMDYYYFSGTTTSLHSPKNFCVQINVYVLDTEDNETLYTGFVGFSGTLQQGNISKHKTFKEISLESRNDNPDNSLSGLFTYFLIISI